MDLATLIGMMGAFGIIVIAMYIGGSLLAFVDMPSILLVFGGSFFVVMMKFGLGQFLGAFKIAVNAFIYQTESPKELIEKAVELASIARKKGLLALESVEIKNAFFRNGVQYLVDGLQPSVVRSMLHKEMNQTVERHEVGQRIFKAIGDVGPAMGMIGTLIGLVQMLGAMNDPRAIGPAMAIALLTTLYGAVLANLLANPIADKLAYRSKQERQAKLLIIDAIMGIQEGQNPRVLEELLNTYLPGSKRKSANGAAREASEQQGGAS